MGCCGSATEWSLGGCGRTADLIASAIAKAFIDQNIACQGSVEGGWRIVVP
jgi:hypothetical protein